MRMAGKQLVYQDLLNESSTASQHHHMISSLSELLIEQATIIDSLMDDGDEVHMFSIDSIRGIGSR